MLISCGDERSGQEGDSMSGNGEWRRLESCNGCKEENGRIGKIPTWGRRKTKAMASEDGKSSECGRGDLDVETSKNAGWIDDSRLNHGMLRRGMRSLVSSSNSRRRMTNLSGMTFLSSD